MMLTDNLNSALKICAEKISSIWVKRCCFCGLDDEAGHIKTSRKVFAYHNLVHHYHDHCYRRVINNPENHTNKQVDTAIEIDEILSWELAKREREDKRRKNRLAAARRHLE